MKLNGTDNIITDLDVTVTGNKHLGNSLRTVIEELDDKVQDLEEQTKWIYANGGVGSGGGGGGGSTKWSIKATLDNVEITSGGTVSLSSGSGNYILRIYTSGGSDTYSVTYTYGNNISRTVTLNSDNGWSTAITLRITENGRISVTASDGKIRREITGCNYIVVPYSFGQPALFRNDGSQYPSGNSDIFVEEAQEAGINIISTYARAVSGEFLYAWYIDGEMVQDWQELEGTSGKLTYVVPREFIVNENAALHSFELRTSSKPDGTLEPVIQSLNGSFNLIPRDLYLKISPNTGQMIYDSNTVLDPYAFSTNNKIALFVRIYNGANATGKSAIIRWTTYAEDGTKEIVQEENTTDGVTNSITVSFTKPGWNYTVFEYSLDGEEGTPITKYFYCEESSSSYNWFVDGHAPAERRWYIAQARQGSGESPLSGITNISSGGTVPLYIEKKSSDINTEYHINNYTANDQLINIGIQYSDINNVQNPILRFYSDENKAQPAITLYQDKIVFGNRFFSSEQPANIFLKKESNYDPDNRDQYHIISINVASCFYVRSAEEGLLPNNTYYEISIYIDGKLEGTVNTKSTVSPELHILELFAGNYAINQIDICRFSASDGNRIIYDSDVNWYWNSFKERIGDTIDSAETLILSELFDANNNNAPTYSIENNLVKVNSAFPSNVAMNANVPVLVVTCARDIVWSGGNTNIYNWMNQSYVDGQIGLNKVTIDIQKLEWSPGKTELTEIHSPDSPVFGVNHFTLDLQGSSTMSNKSKNFTLSIENDEGITEDETILFSPNYVKGESSTFLPETAFTLKADVVDSSHSNNTSMGKFVNENNNWGYRAMQGQTNVDAEILSHVKQCLEGFSMLMFMNVTHREGGTDFIDTYYLGIYNFNLGRDSYFNLGYCDLSQLDPDALTEATVNGFSFCKVGGEGKKGIARLDGFLAAEVQDNSPYWDFSQYDNSILFPLPNTTETGGFMFGDIVDSPNTSVYTEGTIKNFVRSVAAGGGFLFDRVGKDLVGCKETYEDETGHAQQRTYHKPNEVSDYKIQYVRTRTDTDIIYTPTQGDLHDLTEGAITDCILDNADTGHVAPLDYESLVYYYTTCMVFGLVDSVQKNLNIKTWNAAQNGVNTKMGLFFYDMDTCLGKTNAGGKTSYFAFSDFWKSKITRWGYNQQGELVPLDDDDIITEVVKVTNDGTDILRDCFLFGSKVTGYDTPSSYLFAIAKYAATVESVRNIYSNMYPQNIYASWRKKGGILENADKFIDTYFASNLNNIPECLINLNYRNKYLYDYSQHKASFTISESLHGTGIEETKDWLRGRLHILDAYFNLRNAEIIIYNNIPEPKHIQDVTGNDDIYILSDIFAVNNETIGRKSGLTFTVNAADYSPLCVRVGNNYVWYLFEDSTVNYETNVPISGVQMTTFGGSQLWRSLDSINSFVESRDQTGQAFVFNSNTIDTLIGTTGTQTGNWSLIAPALKTIQLTSPNYGGTLNIDRSFTSLTNINLSNSGISLVIDNPNVRTITASNLRNAGAVRITNCSGLGENSVSLNNSLINECSITPAWQDNLDFSNVLAKQLTISAPTSNGTLTISNNSTITSLSFSNIKNLVINNCSNLRTINCIDSNLDILESVTITNCASLQNLTLKSNVLNKLVISNNGILEILNITTNNLSNVRIFDANYTPLHTINYTDPITREVDAQVGGVFDFSAYTRLANSDLASVAYFRWGWNKNLKSIQFYTGNTIRLFYSFTGCENLERVYGSMSIRCTGCFEQCYNFSIHGSDLTNVTWNDRAVRNSNGYVYHPTELYSGDIRNMAKPTAKGITWMEIGIANGSSDFRATNSTIFDMYYILDMCSSTVTNLNYLFYQNRNSRYGYFGWTAAADNSPHVKMFEHCSRVTSAYYFIHGSGTIRFKSPTVVNGVVQEDNGLFSPLTSLESIGWWFTGYTKIADRFVFRRKSGNYAIKTLNDFNIRFIVGDANNLNYNNWSSLDLDNVGNLDGFFTNLPNLQGTVNGLFRNTYTIRYNTINGIPDGVTLLRSSFTSDYGTGLINLNSYFSANTHLNYLYNCFIVGAKHAMFDAPTMNLNNNTFSRFVPRTGYDGLIEVGYKNGGINYDSNYPSGPLSACFSGAIVKNLPIEGFPFNIFRSLTNLKMAAGVFRGATASLDQNYQNLKLPGNLFERNTLLEDCAAEFYDFGVNYQISPTYQITFAEHEEEGTFEPIVDKTDASRSINFINCPNLNNVSFLFGASTDSQYIPKLSGVIPNNLFYHGATVVSSPIIGTNTYGDWEHAETKFQTKVNVIGGIKDMKYCFAHCNCDPYYSTYAVEPNPDWSPFDWIKIENEFVANSTKDTQRYTSQWTYDGETNFSTYIANNVKMLDFVDWDELLDDSSRRYSEGTSTWQEKNEAGTYNDTLPSAYGRFMCAPDLLRFCASNCDISYLFYRSGIPGMNSYWQVTETELNHNKYAYGIKGRICPYLLNTVPNTTNLNGMFSSCKCLSYIRDRRDGKEYLLPVEFFANNSKVKSLQYFMERTVQPHSVEMANVFKPLTETLDIQYAFDLCYWCGASGDYTYVEGVFSDNNIESLTGVFRGNSSLDPSTSHPYGQYVSFKNIFKQNKYNTAEYRNNASFSYGFYGWGTVADLAEELSLSRESGNHNYDVTQ